MNIHSYIEKIKRIPLPHKNQVAGIHIHIRKEDVYEFSFVILKKSNQTIHIQNWGHQITTIKELQSSIPNNIPVILTLSGKGILHKKLKNESQTDQELLNRIFPNANFDHFYLQKQPVGGHEIYTSVIRKETFHKIIQPFTEKFFVVNSILGPFALNRILPITKNLGTDTLTLPEMQVQTYNKQITSFTHKKVELPEQTYTIGSDHIPAHYLIPFATAFCYFTDVDPGNFVLAPELTNQKKEYFYKQIFTLAGWSVLIFLFALLLGNYLYFMHFNQKHAELSAELSKGKNIIHQLEGLKSELERKQTFIREKNILGSTCLSYFADRLAATVPRHIILTELNINPVEGKIKQDESIAINNNTIMISGRTLKGTGLNEWIRTIKTKKWVEKLDIINFQQSQTGNSGEFTLKITFKTTI